MSVRIFVGDVQGCGEELELLLQRAEARFGDAFSLWVVGDLVNRGPANRLALERVRALVEAGRGEYVLGNHELFTISVGLGVAELRPGDTVDEILAAPDADEWVDWLRQRPLVVGGLLGDEPFAMLHGAAHPDWDFETLLARGAEASARLATSRESARAFLEAPEEHDSPRDDLARITRCRSVTPEGGWSKHEPESPNEAWHRAWARREHGYGIVFGHWARQGLYIADGLRGLDSGCVHHGRGRDGFLTAWLPELAPRKPGEREFAAPDDRLWQVPAKRRYYRKP